MATRFYLPSSGAAAVSPTASAGWEDTSINSFLKAVTTKIGSAMTTVSFVDADATNKDVLFRTYVSDPIAAQVISSQTIGLQMRCKERATSCNMFLTWNIKVVSNDGSIVRGTITSMERDGTEASAVALTNRRETSTSTAVTAHSGDRIVIEIGMGGDPAAGSDHDSDISVGDDSATDLAEDDTDTDADNPWVEFPNTLTFFTAGDVIVHDIASDSSTNVSSETLALINSAVLSNTGVLVFAGAYDSASDTDRVVTGVTYGGEALTKLAEDNGDVDLTVYTSWWFLPNPSNTGSNNVVVTYAGTVNEANVHAVSLGNVAQSGQPDASASEIDSAATTFSVDVTTVADRCFIFGAISIDSNGGANPSTGQIEIADTPAGSGYWVSSYEGPISPAALTAHSYTTGASDDGLLIAVSIKPYTAVGTTIKDIITSGFIPFAR